MAAASSSRFLIAFSLARFHAHVRGEDSAPRSARPTMRRGFPIVTVCHPRAPRPCFARRGPLASLASLLALLALPLRLAFAPARRPMRGLRLTALLRLGRARLRLLLLPGGLLLRAFLGLGCALLFLRRALLRPLLLLDDLLLGALLRLGRALLLLGRAFLRALLLRGTLLLLGRALLLLRRTLLLLLRFARRALALLLGALLLRRSLLRR